jgi:hypothetical protein
MQRRAVRSWMPASFNHGVRPPLASRSFDLFQKAAGLDKILGEDGGLDLGAALGPVGRRYLAASGAAP